MIRKAKIKDIKTIYGLLHYYGKKGELLSRPLSELYDHLRDFFVYVDNNEKEEKIVGCCALQFCWEDLSEMRSLVVHPDYLRRKIGSQLSEAALAEAKSFNIKKVFALTYLPKFFERYGFVKIPRSELPLKIWGDCLMCVKFPNCDEIAMMKEL